MKRYLYSDLDRVIELIQPRNLIMFAFGMLLIPNTLHAEESDGVAPRAKMNQQRARRFLAAQQKRVLSPLLCSTYKFSFKRRLALQRWMMASSTRTPLLSGRSF